MTDTVLAEMIRLAPDFYSWGVTVNFEASTDDVVNFIQLTSQDVYNKTFESGDIFLGKDDFHSGTNVQLKAAHQELLKKWCRITARISSKSRICPRYISR